jgi:REP element-mobilizing transposase RayT
MPINSIGKTVQLLKGESAYWANKNNLIKPKLLWAEEYYAISVSDSIVPKVRSYIKSQDEKHGTSTFQEDYNLFIQQYKF